jgi:hypothetical protein
MAQRPAFPFTTTRGDPLLLPYVLATPGGGAAGTPASAAAAPLDTASGASGPPLFPCTHTRAHVSRVGPPHARHGARRGVEARRACVSTARAKPWARWVRPVGSCARTFLQKQEHGSRPAQHRMVGGEARLHAQLTGRRGHGHGAHGCGRPAPAPTSTCISTSTARRPGSQQHETQRKGLA